MKEPDPEIIDMLEKLQGTDRREKAFDELQRYRAEVLALVVFYQDQEREEKVNEASERLKEKIKELLG